MAGTERSREPGRRSPLSNKDPSDEGEATKPAATILRQEISVGSDQLERPARGLFLSAVSAGLDVGFGPLLLLSGLALTSSDELGVRIILALFYAVGFVIVILGRSELFTEHTTLALLPLLSRVATIGQVARLWGLVYAGNQLGALAFSVLAAPLGLALGLFEPRHLDRLAQSLVRGEVWLILGGAIAAGWLMGLVSWLVTAARDTMSQLVIILLVTGAIGFLGLHHSIAGSVEVLLAVFGADLPALAFFRFLALATVGNIIGGVVLVALLKFGHASISRDRLAPIRRTRRRR